MDSQVHPVRAALPWRMPHVAAGCFALTLAQRESGRLAARSPVRFRHVNHWIAQSGRASVFRPSVAGSIPAPNTACHAVLQHPGRKPQGQCPVRHHVHRCGFVRCTVRGDATQPAPGCGLHPLCGRRGGRGGRYDTTPCRSPSHPAVFAAAPRRLRRGLSTYRIAHGATARRRVQIHSTSRTHRRKGDRHVDDPQGRDR